MKSYSLQTEFTQEGAFWQEQLALLQDFFGDNLVALYWIGSTSVPGLLAKPVLDLMPTVGTLHEYQGLKDLGFSLKGENGIPGRLYAKKTEPFAVHLHVFEAHNQEVNKHLVFRDLLREEPKVKEAYAELKLQLKAKFPTDREAYQEGKSTFIQEKTKIALSTLREEKFREPVQVYIQVKCKDKFLLLKRAPNAGAFWQGVTGAPLPGEELMQGAKRELFEETKIAGGNWQKLSLRYLFPKSPNWQKMYRQEVQRIVEHVFVLELEEERTPALSEEHIAYQWCSKEEALKLLRWDNNKKVINALA